MWYTLVRFNEAPQNITAVSQAKCAADALALVEVWERDFPGETIILFDPKNAPINRRNLSELAEQAPASTPAAR